MSKATAAAFAVGLSLATPSMAAADPAENGSGEQPAQVNQDNRAAATTNATSRTTAPREAPQTARRTAARTGIPAASSRSHSPAPAARTRLAAPAINTAAKPSRARATPVAEAEEPTGATGTVSTIGADATFPSVTVAVAVAAPTPPVAAAAPAALSVTAVPDAAATDPATDWLTGLLAPVQSFVEGFALLMRRTFFNEAPTVAPVQTTGQLGGPVTGTIGAVDPDDDALRYEVTVAPRFGSVALAADGSYVYTPGADFTGLDSFNVAVTDAGFHLNLLDLSRPASTEAFLQIAQNATLPTLTFNFVYGTGSQFWSAAARGALQDAAMLLATYLVVDSPVSVVYAVTGESSPSSSTLASAGSELADAGNGFIATVVQRKIQSGVDANGRAADGDITWNFGNPWAFGTAVGPDEYDFISTAMHELLHTFGFLSYTLEPGANRDRSWTTFDQYLVTADGTQVITDSFRWSSTYDANLTGGGGGLFFGGPNAVNAYGGPVPLYTPKPWESGSSVSHLDDDTFTGANTMLMNAVTDTGPGIRVVSPLELAILKDLGYTVTEPVPLQALLLVGFGFVRRRRQRPVS